MDLRSGESFWVDRNRHAALRASPLESAARCDVLVVGGGITGALVADMLSREGVDVIVLDKRDFGAGSTAASTALLMYEIDASLLELTNRYGWERASRCYQASLRGLKALAAIAQGVGEPCDFAWRKSLYLAGKRLHARAFEKECEARRRAGIDVDLLSKSEVAERFALAAPAAILSHDSAQVDPVRLTRALLNRAITCGARAHARTCVADIQHTSEGTVISTEQGPAIRAKTVVIAAGYESGSFMDDPPGSLHSTYVICSRPMPTAPLWRDECLIWESRRPYVYARTTGDGRAIIGGADVKFKNAVARDALLPRRARRLEKRFARMFPDLPFETEYAWTGTFGDSDDGLPYIGSVASRPGCLFAMGYGGNGITWGMLAAEIIRDACVGRTHADARLYSFDRT